MILRNKLSQLTGFILILSLTATADAAAFQDNEHEITINQWLTLDPVPVHLPVYHEQKNINDEAYDHQKIFDDHRFGEINWKPEPGKEIQILGYQQNWNSTDNDTVQFTSPSADNPAFAWAAFYLESDRFTEGTLELNSDHPFRVYMNGDEKGSHLPDGDNSGNQASHSESVRITQGKHLVLIRMYFDPKNNSSWSLDGQISYSGDTRLTLSTDTSTTLDLETLSNQPSLSNVTISDDGLLAAMRVNHPAPPDGSGDSWVEIRNTDDGSVYQTFKGDLDFGQLQWVPDSNNFTYTEVNDGKTSIWLVDTESGDQQRILKDVKDFSSYRWSPTGNFIVFGVTEQRESDKTGVSLLDDLEERRPWHFNRSFLYKLSLPDQSTIRLTAGNLTTSLHDISQDGSKLLFSRNHIDYSVRPYSVNEYVIYDLENHSLDSLFTVPFGGSGSFSADGNTILFTGGPSMFGSIGQNVSDGKVANDYDGQAYLYNLPERSTDPITLYFDPSIEQASWGADGDHIYFLTTDAAYRSIYEYDIANTQFQKINTDVEVISQFDLAKNNQRAVYYGTGISNPVRAYSLDLEGHRSSLLSDPGADHFSGVEFGESRTWTFTTAQGTEIDGHIYYPPGFDENEAYPVIVYYYGGTTPVNRAFGGRYPKELYASKGYLVYVLQPSGAIGYGQEFSALHVNDWGIIVADEIIEGVEKFLDAHSYADRHRVGAIGASYGGFMTMLLLTRTDLFAAGVSHAGISNIASYWGEGFWGFQYSAIATANSFPWNREDIYVGQSPLYSADNVTTPLLFLTGMSDTNVPPGESLQMYTALKLLERETAFIAVDDQDHHILDYQKYKLWKESILAWFDKYLKNQPDWWNEKYGR
jgi:dipeptidyl aminopeptidase/acylaminoacyl peptidase